MIMYVMRKLGATPTSIEMRQLNWSSSCSPNPGHIIAKTSVRDDEVIPEDDDDDDDEELDMDELNEQL
ncbi:hypothetical protein QYF36_008782 [Acer negundo]|nr:hypothetical protein QYF36_008782 [Acer negundo]